MTKLDPNQPGPIDRLGRDTRRLAIYHKVYAATAGV